MVGIGRRDRRREEGHPQRGGPAPVLGHRGPDRELPGRGVSDLCAPRGHALIGRALYLPKSWTEDSDRCNQAGIPQQDRCFATKPGLATGVDRPRGRANVPAAWVAGDEVYGADPRLRAAVRDHGLGYVLAVSANRRVPTDAGMIRVDVLPALIPPRAWRRHSAGAGAHGPRLYSWAWFRLLAEGDADTGVHHLLIRRNDVTGEHAYLRCYSPRPVPLRALVAVAGPLFPPGRRARAGPTCRKEARRRHGCRPGPRSRWTAAPRTWTGSVRCYAA